MDSGNTEGVGGSSDGSRESEVSSGGAGLDGSTAEVGDGMEDSSDGAKDVGPPISSVTMANWTSNGQEVVTLDVAGNNVDAHDGDLHRWGGVFYLYGTSYDCGWTWNGSSTWCGIKVYTSTDLTHWSDAGLAFAPTAQWTSAQRCGGANGCFRPHVVYDPNDGMYVMWINRGGGNGDSNASYYTLTSTSPRGPFVETAATPTLCKRTGNGDVSLFVDGSAGYVIYTAMGSDAAACVAAQRGGHEHRIAIEKLDSSFTNSADPTHANCPSDPCASNATHFAWLSPHTDYENGYVFKRGSLYYAVYQDTCPYCNTELTDPSDKQENVFYQKAMGNPFDLARTPQLDLSAAPRPGRPPGDRACQGQFSFVVDIPSAAGTSDYVYVADLWDDAVSGGKGNQAQANFMWEVLSFGSDDRMEPLKCPDSARLTILGPTSGETSTPQNDDCDIRGTNRRGEVFTPASSGTLSDVSTIVYRSNGLTNPAGTGQLDGNANGNLELGLYATVGGRPAGNPVFSLTLAPDAVSFGRHRVTLHPRIAVLANQQYALVLASPSSTMGCYGWLYSDDKPLKDAGAELYDSGSGWVVEKNRDLYLEVTVTP